MDDFRISSHRTKKQTVKCKKTPEPAQLVLYVPGACSIFYIVDISSVRLDRRTGFMPAYALKTIRIIPDWHTSHPRRYGCLPDIPSTARRHSMPSRHQRYFRIRTMERHHPSRHETPKSGYPLIAPPWKEKCRRIPVRPPQTRPDNPREVPTRRIPHAESRQIHPFRVRRRVRKNMFKHGHDHFLLHRPKVILRALRRNDDKWKVIILAYDGRQSVLFYLLHIIASFSRSMKEKNDGPRPVRRHLGGLRDMQQIFDRNRFDNLFGQSVRRLAHCTTSLLFPTWDSAVSSA